MSKRVLALLSILLVSLALFASGCGSSSHTARSGGHHALLKSVAAGAIAHHYLKKHGSKHALIKSVVIGGVVHHFVKKK
jgi:hypothetical protein